MLRSALAALLAALLLLHCASTTETVDDGRPTLIVEVVDDVTGSGLGMSIAREFEEGTNALVAMRQMVKVYEDDHGMIDSICGVSPDAASHYWTLYVDDEYSSFGLDEYSLEQDTRVRWLITPLPSWALEGAEEEGAGH